MGRTSVTEPTNIPDFSGASGRLDQGDLDAAMERVTLWPTIFQTVDAVCECGENLLNGADSHVILLALVNKVAGHQRTCPKARA